MCGIAGTIYKKDFELGVEITTTMLEALVDSVEKEPFKVDNLLEACWKYKSNCNFLRYCRDKKEQKKIDLICKRLKQLSNKFYGDGLSFGKKQREFKKNSAINEKILDCHWFLSKEIKKWMNGVKYFTGNDLSKQKDSVIVFYKQLNIIFNSIDSRLEMRGRDSLGLGIQLILSSRKSDFKEEDLDFLEKIDDSYVATFIFKVANKIGALGENVEKIKRMTKKNLSLRKIVNNENCTHGTIAIHTRWASVGRANTDNCHPITNIDCKKSKYPLVLSYLNGDIYNYQKLINMNTEKLNISFDKNIETDCLAISASLTSPHKLKTHVIRSIYKTFQGSFVIAIQLSTRKGEIILTKKGNQGLYLGFSYDGVYFASDVYGIIESCRYFYPVRENVIFSISNKTASYGSNLKLKLFGLDRTSSCNISKSDLKTTNITTRDIDKDEYSHFLEKEIFETKDVVAKTIYNYLEPISTNQRTIVINKDQVPQSIVKKLKTGQIKEIIITGMGTCYTAAMAISKYMSEMLKLYSKHKINVKAVLASEGSAFYLKDDMSDVLIIVVAQSGTTIDTNTYVKMATDRGANSLAIVNKREGDVTFLVEGNLYIGNGRDIEIAVPSTKTYTAQVVLGYILTLFFCTQVNKRHTSKELKNLFKKEFEELWRLPQTIDQSFDFLQATELSKLRFIFPLSHNYWYVAYDESPNAICAKEIVIKLSENCYQSLPCIHLDELVKDGVKDSFIVLISNDKSETFKSKLNQLLKNNNYVILISSVNHISKEYQQELKKEKLFILDIPNTRPTFSFVPTVIAGQLLSYYLALALDKRKHAVDKLIKSIEEKKDIDKNWIKFTSKVADGYFNQGFSLHFFKELYKTYSKFQLDKSILKYKRKLLKQLRSLYELSIRPIDTIKHQAKTITVGASRLKQTTFDQQKITAQFITIESLNKDFYQGLKHNKQINSQIDNIVYILSRCVNWKALGSGANYSIAKATARLIIRYLNRPCAFDILENHKHIDISAESGLLIFLGNIFDYAYQADAFSEIEKMLSHNNFPIIFTNINDNRFDQLKVKFNKNKSMLIPVIKLPVINGNDESCRVHKCVINKIIAVFKEAIKHKNDNLSMLAFNPLSELL